MTPTRMTARLRKLELQLSGRGQPVPPAITPAAVAAVSAAERAYIDHLQRFGYDEAGDAALRAAEQAYAEALEGGHA